VSLEEEGCRTWWCTPVIPALGRLRQEDREFRPCFKKETERVIWTESQGRSHGTGDGDLERFFSQRRPTGLPAPARRWERQEWDPWELGVEWPGADPGIRRPVV
jgi:hypothetical protein